jgi:cell division protein FtsA
MKYFRMNPIYSIIDIGTTKIIFIIAEKNTAEEIIILGIGSSPSHGLEKGMVSDIKKTTQSIQLAMEEAIAQAGIEPEYVTIGISGHHIKSYFSEGMVSINSEGITEKTVREAIAASQSIVLPEDEKIIHAIPISYLIDGYDNIKNPIGRHGVRLEVITHIITANKNAIEDLVSCCKKIGLKIKDITLEPIASSEAVLNEEEKWFGALVIDIGGGTSDIAFYQKNTIKSIQILDIAGVLFTNDLSICLNCSKNDAEKLKKEYGISKKNNHQNKNISITSLDGKNENHIDPLLIGDILFARAEELILEVSKVIKQFDFSYEIPSGIILTGGGSLLKGLPEMFSKYTAMRCRIGIPLIGEKYSLLQSPTYSTACGLLHYAITNDLRFTKEKEHSFTHKFKKFIHFLIK